MTNLNATDKRVVNWAAAAVGGSVITTIVNVVMVFLINSSLSGIQMELTGVREDLRAQQTTLTATLLKVVDVIQQNATNSQQFSEQVSNLRSTVHELTAQVALLNQRLNQSPPQPPPPQVVR